MVAIFAVCQAWHTAKKDPEHLRILSEQMVFVGILYQLLPRIPPHLRWWDESAGYQNPKKIISSSENPMDNRFAKSKFPCLSALQDPEASRTEC